MEEQNDECRAIVMEYLLHYCYKNSAQALLKEMSNLDNCGNITNDTNSKNTSNKKKSSSSLLDEKNIEWVFIDARKDISDAIKSGDVGKAFSLIEQHFPNIIKTYNTINRTLETTIQSDQQLRKQQQQQSAFPKSHYILYKLRCQQFIETLRSSGDLQAIQFAQYYLRPCHKLYTELTNSVTTLIAYTDFVENDKTKDLLSQKRRDDIADEVNEMILESQQFSAQTALEKLWRQKTAVQVELDNQKRQESLKDQKEAENLEKVQM